VSIFFLGVEGGRGEGVKDFEGFVFSCDAF